MKYILIFVFLLPPCVCISQKKLEYEYKGNISGLSANELYRQSLVWFATTYNSANDVIQFKDEMAGKIIGRAKHKFSPSYICGAFVGMVSYQVTIDVKPERYRIVIDAISHVTTHPQGADFGIIYNDEQCSDARAMMAGAKLTKRCCAELFKDLDSLAEVLANSLFTHLQKKSAGSATDDW